MAELQLRLNSESKKIWWVFALFLFYAFFPSCKANKVNSGCFLVVFWLELEKQLQQRVEVKSYEKKRVTDEQ